MFPKIGRSSRSLILLEVWSWVHTISLLNLCLGRFLYFLFRHLNLKTQAWKNWLYWMLSKALSNCRNLCLFIKWSHSGIIYPFLDLLFLLTQFNNSYQTTNGQKRKLPANSTSVVQHGQFFHHWPEFVKEKMLIFEYSLLRLFYYRKVTLPIRLHLMTALKGKLNSEEGNWIANWAEMTDVRCLCLQSHHLRLCFHTVKQDWAWSVLG